ncbi:hypothetical protein KA529_02500 [Candidatus Saccharibacteria bacterium]|nr:hypothetical protein [Candidatus Saccharibacteria bacterium]
MPMDAGMNETLPDAVWDELPREWEAGHDQALQEALKAEAAKQEPEEVLFPVDDAPSPTIAEIANEFKADPIREQRFGGSVLEILMEKGDFTLGA